MCFAGVVVVRDAVNVLALIVIAVLTDVVSVVALTVIELADRNRSGRTELVDTVVVDIDVNSVVALTVDAVVVDIDLDSVVALTVDAVVVNIVIKIVVALTIDAVVVDIDLYSVVTLVVVIVGIVRAVEVVEVLVATIFFNFSCCALGSKLVQARKFQSSGRLVSLLLRTHEAPRIPAGLPARIGVFCSFAAMFLRGASKSVD